MPKVTLVLWIGILFRLSSAQFPPTPTDLTIVTSEVDKAVKISYKQTDICETTAGVKSYSGYVHLPGSILTDVGGYNISSYFLYFEARHNASTAPLAIYLAGGPGESSTFTALSSESGPCYVNVTGNDTTLNPWSLNNYVNMLYIDQPSQVGYSYSQLINGTYDLETLTITPYNFSEPALPDTNATFGIGTFSNQDPLATTNTTVTSAKALWHFAEHWLSSFPEYSSSSQKVSVWGNSYGGYWVPEVAAVFSKHLKTLPSKHPLKSKNLSIDTVGITNGCIDFESSYTGYPQFAYNNTYDVRFINESIYQDVMNNITKPDGCVDLIKTCRLLGDIGDPEFTGSNQTVNEACTKAFEYCYQINLISDTLNNRTAFDIAVHLPDPCPFYLPVSSYLNSEEIQSALGVPLNFTYDSDVVTANFGSPPYTILGTGDPYRQSGMQDLQYLLADGAKVTLIYGDRDYRCPWTVGIATANAFDWKNQKGFLAAGYEELQGISPRGGVVKQYGQLSFSRIFDAGHAVSAYAPEAVYSIFQRAMFGKDIVSGECAAGPDYHTKGPTDSWGWRNKLPEPAPQSCMVAGEFQAVNPWAGIS